MDRVAALHSLAAEIDHYLSRFEGAGVNNVRAGLARWGGGVVHEGAASGPACGGLDEALAAVEQADPLKSVIAAAQPFLDWVTYDLYPAADIGPRFPKSHAFASLIGGGAPLRADGYELGLFLIAQRALYRDHHHAAPELYAPLTGPHRWRFGTDQPWLEKPAHEPVWNEPWDVHATIVGETPFLCIFAWTADVNIAAKTVYAADWDVIEARL